MKQLWEDITGKIFELDQPNEETKGNVVSGSKIELEVIGDSVQVTAYDFQDKIVTCDGHPDGTMKYRTKENLPPH